uniref:Major facilitator superfamily (MFS) profile domain-containing protein n=1 Tax=Haptolina brevifila TaxID=156173 RepID=A0A7S2DV55_9EUKA
MATSGRSFLAARFLCGFAEGGVPTTSYGWAGEFLLPAHKPRAGIALQIGFVVGTLLVTLGSYSSGEHQWRALSAVVSFCSLPIALLCLFAPESPRWLHRAGLPARASAVLHRIAHLNGRGNASPASIELTVGSGAEEKATMLPPLPRDEPLPNPLSPRTRQQPSLFRLLVVDATFRRVLLLLCLHWCVYSALFFGLSLHEAHDVHAALLASSCQIPTVFCTALSFDRFGRRSTMLVLLCAASFACAAMATLAAGLPAPEGTHALLSTIGVATMSGSFAGGYIFSSELLPTDVRAVGLALCSQSSRVGGFFSPFALLIKNPAVPYTLWSAAALIAGFSSLWLPETLGEPSLESLDDLRALVSRRAGRHR